MQNKLIIAAAGSGKTTTLVNEALAASERTLITTFTQANEHEIRKKFIEINKCVPPHVSVQTWFSFLLKHGVRPFQPFTYEKKIKGLLLVNGTSGVKTQTKNGPIYYSEEKEFERHYFSPTGLIYSDKLSKFVLRCDSNSQGSVIDRISQVYPNIFVDEVQDMAGYDLELFKLLLGTKSKMLFVGDPRQGTYSTNTNAKNKQFRKTQVVNFFEAKDLPLQIDDSSLNTNYRSNSFICDLSNALFPEYKACNSGSDKVTDHDGIFFIKPTDVTQYLETFRPMQLRDSIKTVVNTNHAVMSFGESKGLTFTRVLIYPTVPMIEWLKNHSSELAPTSRSKFYVALTRARHSVGIVYDHKKESVSGITNFTF